MISRVFLFIGLGLFSTTSAMSLLNMKSQLNKIQTKAEANEFIDALLKNLSELVLECGLDPMPLEDAVIGFETSILGITFSGHIGFNEGFARGLSNVVRAGEASLDFDWTTGLIALDAPLRITNVQFGYSLYIEFMGLEISPSAAIIMESVEIDLAIDASLAVPPVIEVTKLSIHSIKGLSIDIDAIGIIDWMLEIFIGVIANFVKGVLVFILQGPLKAIINDLLANPGDGGGIGCYRNYHELVQYPVETIRI